MTATVDAVAATRRFWSPGRGERASNRTAYLFLAPALLVMAIITFYPLVFQVWLSFTDYGLRNLRVNAPAPNIVGFDNYLRVLGNDIVLPNFEFLRVLVFNLFW